MDPIRSTADLHAHALAMEEEAAHRYVDLAMRMLDEGNKPLAKLFWRLGRMEGEHYSELLRRAHEEGIPLLPLPAGTHRWMDAAPQAREIALRLVTPRRALALAIDAERRARDFFHEAAASAADPKVRELARALADEESAHIDLLLQAISRAPAEAATATDWDRLFIECAAPKEAA
jgi:rubrerythrin